MGTPRPDTPEILDTYPTVGDRSPADDRIYVPRAPARYELPPRRTWRHVLLFVLTVFTTTLVGGSHYAAFVNDFGGAPVELSSLSFYLNGLWYSVAILAILGTHEFGHYYACRYYRVDASLPYFLPAPLPLTGTLGAFIRIRQMIPGKRELFDIGIAGPIAGFIVAVPVLLLGMSLSRVVALPAVTDGIVELGEPLLFKGAAWLVFGSVPDGYSINMHPMAFAAWFGLLATALNLFPIGQLDGGHISYAVLGRKSTHVTLATVACLVALSFISSSWIVWTVLTVAMLVTFGPRHPRTFDEDVPLDRTRLILAVFAAAMFVLCFTPAPIEPFQLLD
jgi:membrane-associated protease RseP (regulator of RpoE activity)